MDLEELEQMIKDAKSPREFFGKDLNTALKKFLAVCHPDRNPGNPKSKELFELVNNWAELAQEPPIVIKSSKRSYEILRRIAIGDTSDIYTAESDDKDYLLKISRIVGGDIYLNNEKQIISEILTEARAKTYSKYLPTLVESFPAKDSILKRVNVYSYDSGLYPLEQVYEKYLNGVDGRHVGWMFNRMLTGLGFFHNCGYVHGAVLPSHVLINAESHGAVFCGWVHAVKIGQKLDTISIKYNDWYPPEVISKKPVSPATDIYMAAKCVKKLLLEKDTSSKMERFFRSCLLESPGMRPQNAWDLLDEFKEVLEDLYGKRRFTVLTMN